MKVKFLGCSKGLKKADIYFQITSTIETTHKIRIYQIQTQVQSLGRKLRSYKGTQAKLERMIQRDGRVIQMYSEEPKILPGISVYA